jgi:hypothetical protein
MLILETSNIEWFGQANKYLEAQYEWKKNWGEYEVTKKDNYDEAFEKEFEFLCSQ